MKLQLYARQGIRQYVIVNLQDGCLEVYEDPVSAEGRYASSRIVQPGQALSLQLATGTLHVQTDDWMPWRG